MHAYINGNDVGWVIITGLLILFTGVLGVFAALILPERYQLRGYLFLACAFTAITGFVISFVMMRTTYSANEIDAGRHWKTECSLIEVNVQGGFFNGTVNKLNCDGVMVNAPAYVYERYIQQWQLLQIKGVSL